MVQEVPAGCLDGQVALHVRRLRHMPVPQSGVVGAPVPEVPDVFEPFGEVADVEGAEILGQGIELVRSGRRSGREEGFFERLDEFVELSKSQHFGRDPERRQEVVLAVDVAVILAQVVFGELFF